MSIKSKIDKLKKLMKPRPVIKWTFDEKEITNDESIIWVLFKI